MFSKELKERIEYEICQGWQLGTAKVFIKYSTGMILCKKFIPLVFIISTIMATIKIQKQYYFIQSWSKKYNTVITVIHIATMKQ